MSLLLFCVEGRVDPVRSVRCYEKEGVIADFTGMGGVDDESRVLFAMLSPSVVLYPLLRARLVSMSDSWVSLSSIS